MEYGILSSALRMEENDSTVNNNEVLKFQSFDDPDSLRMVAERDSRSGLEDQTESGSYVLRENPKKSMRFVDSKELRFCKECGKGFQSMKALCGHMACHSEKERVSKDHRRKSKLAEAMDSQSDTESSGPKTRRASRRIRYKSFGCSSGIEKEQQEVAISLMLLSRDCRSLNSMAMIAESSSNNSVVVEARSSSIDMIVNAKRKKVSAEEEKKVESDDSEDEDEDEYENSKGFSKYELRKRTTRIRVYRTEEIETYKHAVKKRGKYECSTCNKTFSSHTALGGHRASHAKSNNGCCGDIGENSVETHETTIKNPVVNLITTTERKRSKGHECPICFRMFKSGQALGGHKRSHFVGGRESNSTSVIGRDPTPEPEITVLFDLNLPAPMEEDVGFMEW